MPVLRFEGFFHQSILNDYKTCPRACYFNQVVGLWRTKTSRKTLAGSSGHSTFEMAHRENIWEPAILFEFWQDDYERRQFEAIEKGLELVNEINPNDYFQIIEGYASREYNRTAIVVAAEQPFEVEIKPGRTGYPFRGTIDQVAWLDVAQLAEDYPWIGSTFQVPRILVHRDFKFGRVKHVSPAHLAMNTQIDTYSIGLAKGEFLHEDRAPERVNYEPDLHCLCFLQDLVPPKNLRGNYLKDDNDNYIPCHIGGQQGCDIRADGSKRASYCKGQRSWCPEGFPWQPSGVEYWTTRDADQRKAAEQDIGRICAAIRLGLWFRCGNDLCDNYCGFKDACMSDRGMDLDILEAA